MSSEFVITHVANIASQFFGLIAAMWRMMSVSPMRARKLVRAGRPNRIGLAVLSVTSLNPIQSKTSVTVVSVSNVDSTGRSESAMANEGRADRVSVVCSAEHASRCVEVTQRPQKRVDKYRRLGLRQRPSQSKIISTSMETRIAGACKETRRPER